MADAEFMPRVKGLRHHVRKRKDGSAVTYYYLDRRSERLKPLALGTDYRRAVGLVRDYMEGKAVPRRIKTDTASMPPEPKKGCRRKMRNEPLWLEMPEWARLMYLNAERRAKGLDRPFTLTVPYVHQLVQESRGRCAISGIPFEVDPNIRRAPFAPSLDRIDSTRGYVDGNVRLVCTIVNFALNSWGEGPLMRVAQALCGTAQDGMLNESGAVSGHYA